MNVAIIVVSLATFDTCFFLIQSINILCLLDLTRLPPRHSTVDGMWTRKPFLAYRESNLSI